MSIEAIKEALKAGPTEGPWFRNERLNGPFWHIWSEHSVGGRRCLSGRQAVASVHGESKRGAVAYASMFEANANFITACNPVAIRSLIERLEAAEKDAERYRWLRQEVYSQDVPIKEASLILKIYGSCPDIREWDAAIDSAMAGGLAERFKAPVLKTGEGLSPP